MSERNLYEVTGDIKDINTLLVPRAQLEAMVGSQEPVAKLHDDGYWTPMKTEAGRALNDRLMRAGSPSIDVYAAPVAQQQQAEVAPVVDRVYEAAKRLVDHADFQLGGVLSAKSKARDIPSNAASKVKARHLASLRDALAKTPHQAEAVPPDVVRDAERYRWLRDQTTDDGIAIVMKNKCINDSISYAENINKHIDAAISQQKGGV